MKQIPVKYFVMFASIAVVGCILLLIIPGPAYADMNGITLKGAFNGKEVTSSDAHTDDPITGVTLKVDEPFTLDFYVTPVKDGIVGVELAEPGEDKLMSYYRISGDEIGSAGNSIDKNCTAGQTVHYHWELAPNDKWANGNCPISIIWDVWQRDDKKDISGRWGFVNPHISSDQYSGGKPSTSTGSPDNNGTKPTGTATPGFSVLPAIVGFLVALAFIGVYRRR